MKSTQIMSTTFLSLFSMTSHPSFSFTRHNNFFQITTYFLYLSLCLQRSFLKCKEHFPLDFYLLYSPSINKYLTDFLIVLDEDGPSEKIFGDDVITYSCSIDLNVFFKSMDATIKVHEMWQI